MDAGYYTTLHYRNERYIPESRPSLATRGGWGGGGVSVKIRLIHPLMEDLPPSYVHRHGAWHTSDEH